MIFWLAILVGGVFAFVAVKIGFYETWVALFNIVVSAYIALFATPTITQLVPAAVDTPYGKGLCLLAIGLGCFAILQGLSFVFITGQFSVSFPKLFDSIGSGVLGFLAGFLTLSYLSLVVTATPLSEQKILRSIGLTPDSQQANISYICWWGDRVNSVVGYPEAEQDTRATVEHLLADNTAGAGPDSPSDPNGAPSTPGQSAPDSPPGTADPNASAVE